MTETPANLQMALQTLSEDYPLLKSLKLKLQFKKIDAPQRTFKISKNLIEYTDLSTALRAVGTMLSNVTSKQEQTSFKTFGIMLDCSRNAVMKVDHFKGWLRRLALLGYNMAMLYTEDTYQLPGEPNFGYLRGAYSADELREIDRYASQLGIEMIPCIQTLGHLEQILKWGTYGNIKDTQRVLLVGEEKTYALIEKMIKQWSQVYKTKRIHIGMDETHDLGRGKYLDLHGYKKGFEIYNEHLIRVMEICRKHGREVMMWSDMYLRPGSKTGDYWDKNWELPEITSKIPKDVEMVYWDYYHDTEQHYRMLIDRHRQMGFEPIMGHGVWTWASLWHNKKTTERCAGPGIKACQKAGLKEIFFTMWGDDGAFCEYDSAMAGLMWTAELAYTGQNKQSNLEKRFSAICGGDYKATSAVSDLCFSKVIPDDSWGPEILWDDPIFAMYWHDRYLRDKRLWPMVLKSYRAIIDKLKNNSAKTTNGGDLNYGLILTKTLMKKIELNAELFAAYQKKDKRALKKIIKEIPKMIDLYQKTEAAFKTQWLRRNKVFGLEVAQIRFSGLVRRYAELNERLSDFVAGKIERIDEFENRTTEPFRGLFTYRNIATPSFIL